MAVTSVKANAAPAALTIGSETTLESPSITAAGTYVLVIETDNLALGDTLEMRAKSKGVTTTLKVAYLASYTNPQSEVVKYSLPVVNEGSQVSFTLKQTAGTGRVIPWRILSL